MPQISSQASIQNKGVLRGAANRACITLCVLAPLSLVQFYVIARVINPLFTGTPLSWVASIRLPAFLISVLVVGYFGRESLRWPMQIRRYAWVVAMAMISMLATYVAIYVVHVWVPKLPTAGGLIIFLGTGLLAEEFWFRGAILLLAEKACSRHQHRWAILLSAACYGLSHWQYHGFALTTAAAMQIAYTFLLGLLLGLLRRQTQSLWPAVGLHLAVNIVAVMAIG